jgi:Rrf2 family protein
MELIKRNTDYALRALTFMAEGREGAARISDLAAATGAPEDFLRKVVRKLDAAGIVATRRGPGGGVVLNKAPSLISVFDVVEAVQGPFAVNRCFVTDADCADRKGCVIRRNLNDIQDDMVAVFKRATVENLAVRRKPRTLRSNT